MIHPQPHPLAGKTVKIVKGSLAGEELRLEDWWDRVGPGSWKWANGNPACLSYAMRTGTQDFKVPSDDEVIYGKVGPLGYLVHASELEGQS